MIWRYEGIRGSALGGMFYCCIGSDGMVRGCPDQPVRYDEECLGSGSFEEIWRGGFKRNREYIIALENTTEMQKIYMYQLHI